MEILNLDELIKIRKIVSQYTNMGELIHDLDITISNRKKKKKKSLNTRFDIMLMIELKILEPDEINVLLNNKIYNLQDLLDCDLDLLKGIDNSIKERLEWKRNFYNMNSLEEIKKTK